MTDRQLLKDFKTEKAELLQNWMGKEDFLYCHQNGLDEDAVFEALDAVGANNIMVNIPNKMQLYLFYIQFTDQPMVNPDKF